MVYENTVPGVFISRPNRFEATVGISGKKETVHVKNTGRCRELLIPGRNIMLARSENTQRKTKYDLISVEKPGVGWINIDSQLPNKLVYEWLCDKDNRYFHPDVLRPEYTYGNSRVDMYLEEKDRKILIEVKGCTLEKEGVGYFPDAPTARGVKHLNELSKAVSEGYKAYIAFVITIPDVTKVLPNGETDPLFEETYIKARSAGVSLLLLPCRVGPSSVEIIKDKVVLTN